MWKTLVTFVLPFSLSVLGLAGCDKAPVKNTPIATIGDEEVSEADFLAYLQRVKAKKGGVTKKPQALLDDVVQRKLLQEAARRELPQSGLWLEVEEATARILRSKLMEHWAPEAVPTQEDITSYYQANTKQFLSPFRYRAQHILVRAKHGADAKAIDRAQRLLSGALEAIQSGKDFAIVGKQLAATENGVRYADLGLVEKGKLHRQFEAAALGLEVNEISGIVKTSFGYHIIQLLERRPTEQKTLEQVQGTIRKQLFAQKREEIYKQKLSSLKRTIPVYIDEDRVSSILP